MEIANLVFDRRLWSVAGIAALLMIPGFIRTGDALWEGRVAGIAFICFTIAIVGALAQTIQSRQVDECGVLANNESVIAQEHENSKYRVVSLTDRLFISVPRWLIPLSIVVGVTALAAQTWFAGGGFIAGGDQLVPAGTAWLSHLFSPWTWNGSNLGGPGVNTMALPEAIIGAFVHALGGSAALAQRIWLTVLFTGVGAGAAALISALGFGTLSTVGGALVYAFSPFVVSYSGFDRITLATLGLVPALIAWVVATSQAKQVRWRLIAMVPAAVMAGYVAQNPPLFLSCVAALLFGPILVGWLYGRRLLWSAFRRTALGVGVIAVASAYWAVPYLIQLLTTPAAQAGKALTWKWQETRSTVANGFWLNTTWPWAYSEYFPYAHWYNQFPLVFVKYLLPVAAFGTLGIGGLRVKGRDGSRLRLIIAASAVALFIILFSMGTRFPGSFIFDPLYSLPYGWLLQAPGRFLFGTGLAYAILIAIGLESAIHKSSTITKDSIRDASNPPRHSPWRFSLAVLCITVLVLPGWPLMTGTVVLAAQSGFPSQHVRLPAYWASMANFVNRSAPAGNVLVLPEDDFYQMPYTWFYGTDGFISQIISRNLIDPVGQGYSPASSELVSAVNLLQQSALAHDWSVVKNVAQALDSRELLVRVDVQNSFPGRNMANPSALVSAFASDPNLRLIDKSGLLDLFSFRQPLGTLTHPVTVNSRTPDLKLLSLLPSGSALISSSTRRGIPTIEQLVPLGDWTVQGNVLTTSVLVPPHRKYNIALLSGSGVGQLLEQSSITKFGHVKVRKVSYAGSTKLYLSVRLGRDLVPSSQLVVLAEPFGSQNVQFLSDRVSYSPYWDGPPGATHVLVDGMTNGWIDSKSLGASRPYYEFAGIITEIDVATFVGVGGLLCIVIGYVIRRRRRITMSSRADFNDSE